KVYSLLRRSCLSVFDSGFNLDLGRCFDASETPIRFTGVAEALGHLLVAIGECEHCLARWEGAESSGFNSHDAVGVPLFASLQHLLMNGPSVSEFLGLASRSSKPVLWGMAQKTCDWIPLSAKLNLAQIICNGLIEWECRSIRWNALAQDLCCPC